MKFGHHTDLHEGREACGFSLIELLVVLAIMSLLAGIGFSGMQGMRRWLDETTARSLFMELQTACRLYRLEHGNWPDRFNRAELDLSDPDVRANLVDVLGPYMETRIDAGLLERELPGQRLYLVVDLDGDHWLRASDFVQLGEVVRPATLWDRAAAYTLDSTGALISASWTR